MGSWKKSPIMKFLLSPVLPFYKAYCKSKWDKKWAEYVSQNANIQLNVGASVTRFEGWFPTDIEINSYYLDVTDEACYQKMFGDKKISKILAEHVFEHLTTEQIQIALQLFYKYSTEDINIRIAVPDGFHTDSKYIEEVKIGGTGYGSNDHKQLFTYQSLGKLFEQAGFQSFPVEYWDENGVFHAGYQDDDKGLIRRSMLHDARNKDGKPNYTSLIMDFRK
jgi:predicted SAM-dependent methyltransferase